MGSTNANRSETIVTRVVDTIPATTTAYTVNLPAGTYNVGVAVKSNVTGTSSTVTLRHFVDAAQSQTNGVDLRMFEPDDSTAVAALTTPAGAAGRFGTVVPSGTLGMQNIVIPHGLQVTITKGGATTGETYEVDIIASRIS